MSQNNIPSTLKSTAKTVSLPGPLYAAIPTQYNPYLQAQVIVPESQLSLSLQMVQALYPRIPIDGPASPLPSTPSTLNPESSPTPPLPASSAIDHIKPLSDPMFKEPRDGSWGPDMKDVIASAIKHGGVMENRTEVYNEIQKHQPWIINRSLNPECEGCIVDLRHAKGHAINNISYILSSCPGFTRVRGQLGYEVWALSGEPITLNPRKGKNACQKDSPPPGGRKKGRPPKVLRETQIQSAWKKADGKAKVASARKRRADAKIGMPPLDTENSGTDNGPRATDLIALPQTEEFITLPYPAQPSNSIGIATTSHLDLGPFVEYPGHLQPGNLISSMLAEPPYLGAPPLVEYPQTFHVAEPIDPMSQLYLEAETLPEYLSPHQPGNIMGWMSMAPQAAPLVEHSIPRPYHTGNLIGPTIVPHLALDPSAGYTGISWQYPPPQNLFAPPSGYESLQ
ncbi:hypothetical protein M407DRAFT_24647 [Tulasnella calospora MUT 4182]|uniref:Uncharacterized protein n=1 Tax=Tulasnella calospora MUT 4182 TaxID=1051891 RepID=A0A0C3QJ28_9AGAM|nr:hypothetical protein M407DRAFT_24647 [Tulasnella calospora MUT 4182]